MNPVISDLSGTILYLRDQRNMERERDRESETRCWKTRSPTVNICKSKHTSVNISVAFLASPCLNDEPLLLFWPEGKRDILENPAVLLHEKLSRSVAMILLFHIIRSLIELQLAIAFTFYTIKCHIKLVHSYICQINKSWTEIPISQFSLCIWTRLFWAFFTS